MWRAAAAPSSQPTTGVRASTTPKITPMRRASDQRGRTMQAPLPSAAAKASVAMARPSRTMENRVMAAGRSGLGGHTNGRRARPELRLRLVGLANHEVAPPRPSGAECVDGRASGKEAGYSPKRSPNGKAVRRAPVQPAGDEGASELPGHTHVQVIITTGGGGGTGQVDFLAAANACVELPVRAGVPDPPCLERGVVRPEVA